MLGKSVRRTQQCNSEDRQGVTWRGDLRAPSLTLGSAAKIGLAVKLLVSVLKKIAKRYFPTVRQWINFSQALERFLSPHSFQQHPNIA
jgi:hypothetical protein